MNWSDSLVATADTLKEAMLPMQFTATDSTVPAVCRYTPFESSQFFHPEIITGVSGVASDPLPYSVASDNLISTILLVVTVLVVIGVFGMQNLMTRQWKSFFYGSRGLTTNAEETSMEKLFQVVLVAANCLLLGIFFYCYAKMVLNIEVNIPREYFLMMVTFVILAYELIKNVAQKLVNWTFFNKENILQWNHNNLFIQSLECTVVMPMVLLYVYFNISIENTLLVGFVGLMVFKLLAFYKTGTIFFVKNGHIMQFFLYLCTLEIVPFVVTVQLLLMCNDYLTVIF